MAKLLFDDIALYCIHLRASRLAGYLLLVGRPSLPDGL